MDRDLGLIDRLERLYPAVVADCLDRLGARAQVLDPRIRPLTPATRLAGYAATVRCVTCSCSTTNASTAARIGASASMKRTFATVV